MNFKLVVITYCAALFVAGCQEDLVDDLAGRRFVLQSAQGFQPLAGTTVTLGFQERELSLSAGCNGMFGDYRIEDDVLLVSSVGSTEIGCDQERHQQDAWFASFLTSRPKLALDENTLTLTGASATLVFLDREIANPDRALVGATWSVDTFLSKDAASNFALATDPTIVFASDGSFRVATTCNVGGGSYSVSGSELTLTNVNFDQAVCTGSSGAADTQLRALFGNAKLSFEIDAQRLTLKAGDTGVSATAP